MIRISAHGRLGQDPQALTTKSGKPMARASIAVDVTAHNAEQPETEWLSVVAFGRAAEDLLRCKKGHLVAVSGSLSRNRWKAKDGTEKVGWQVLAEDLHGAATVRPTGGKPVRAEAAPRPSPAPVAAGSIPGIDSDDIPF
jgi:single-strand DNA-binding protein